MLVTDVSTPHTTAFWQPGDIVSAVNLDRIIREDSDIPLLLQKSPSLFVQGLKPFAVGANASGDEEDILEEQEDGDGALDDDPSPGETQWQPLAGNVATRDHLLARKHFAQEQRMNSHIHRYMRSKVNLFTASFPDVRNDLAYWMNTVGLRETRLVTRISEGHHQAQLQFNTSLTRQRQFLSLFAPQPFQIETINGVSIARDGAYMIDLLDIYRNTIVLVTSLDRLVRNHRAMRQIQNVCNRNNITIISMLWPPRDIATLSALPLTP